ncbi:P-loop NTPase [Acholeplasma equirhinis]|uniref:P-loop NTPase n=1 Tax=Acholeplasma equirhinis TaxID=555393 RepID=UPI00197AF88F|nr:P-loop NTPase [Acholeplasma equirhinis]MBN3490659.1 P-loop NTPase [Acholeplasma equirhinis]
MSKFDDLKLDLLKLVDPTLNLSFEQAGSLVAIAVNEHDVVEMKVALKSRKKDETKIKLDIARLVKVKYQYPGLKIEFTDSKFSIDEERKVTYIGVISGKGGVGKSTVTANLALAFQRLGKVVGVIDTDVYGASLPSIFQIPIEPLSTTEDDELIPAEKDGIQVISPEFFMPKNQPLMWRGPMLGKLLMHFFENTAWDPDTEFIFVDLPPGTGDVQLDVQSFIPHAKMVLVTTPHPNASHVALKAGLGAKEIGHEVLGVVENMSYYFNEANGKNEFIFGEGGGKMVADTINAPLLTQIPINQPLDQTSYLFSLEDMNGKLYYKLAQDILNLIQSEV